MVWHLNFHLLEEVQEATLNLLITNTIHQTTTDGGAAVVGELVFNMIDGEIQLTIGEIQLINGEIHTTTQTAFTINLEPILLVVAAEEVQEVEVADRYNTMEKLRLEENKYFES